MVFASAEREILTPSAAYVRMRQLYETSSLLRRDLLYTIVSH